MHWGYGNHPKQRERDGVGVRGMDVNMNHVNETAMGSGSGSWGVSHSDVERGRELQRERESERPRGRGNLYKTIAMSNLLHSMASPAQHHPYLNMSVKGRNFEDGMERMEGIDDENENQDEHENGDEIEEENDDRNQQEEEEDDVDDDEEHRSGTSQGQGGNGCEPPGDTMQLPMPMQMQHDHQVQCTPSKHDSSVWKSIFSSPSAPQTQQAFHQRSSIPIGCLQAPCTIGHNQNNSDAMMRASTNRFNASHSLLRSEESPEGIDHSRRTTSTINTHGDNILMNQRVSDRYLLKHVLGSGVHGVVYEAIDVRRRRRVAVKRVQSVFADKNQARNVVRELWLLSRLCHENVISLVDAVAVNERECGYHDDCNAGMGMGVGMGMHPNNASLASMASMDNESMSRNNLVMSLPYSGAIPFRVMHRDTVSCDVPEPHPGNGRNIISAPIDVSSLGKDKKVADLFIVTELMDTDLRSVIRSDVALALTHVRFIMYQLCSALSYLDSVKVVHRDIKPANILINENWDVKLADFGLARVLSSHEETFKSNSVISRFYQAPEVLLREKSSVALDMWSVGCVFAELLLRKPLFEAASPLAQVEKIASLLGNPTHETINKFESSESRRFLKSLPDYRRKKFPDMLEALEQDGDGFNLLMAMLEFDSSRRIAAKDALRHPFFTKMGFDVVATEDMEAEDYGNQMLTGDADVSHSAVPRSDPLVDESEVLTWIGGSFSGEDEIASSTGRDIVMTPPENASSKEPLPRVPSALCATDVAKVHDDASRIVDLRTLLDTELQSFMKSNGTHIETGFSEVPDILYGSLTSTMDVGDSGSPYDIRKRLYAYD